MTRGRQQNLQQCGLYDPDFEHSSCGVGLVAHMSGTPSHKIIEQAIEILANLEHRGATGYDPRTGDGAGILFQLPHRFLEDATGDCSFSLPAKGDYATGLVFLPPSKDKSQLLMQICEDVVKAEALEFLGWRKVPTQSEAAGELAKESEPDIWQIFIKRGSGLSDDAAFERKLYVIRKQMELHGRKLSSFFYIPSLSHRTMNYKGLLLAPEIPRYYPDLSHPLMESALAIVHQRYSTNTFPSWDLAHPFRFLCHNGEINTLRGNIHWMKAREAVMESRLFGDDLRKVFPIIPQGLSDSASLDCALELIYHGGRSLEHAVAMLIPEAWENHQTMSDSKKAFYEYHSCFMEPWDGPASIAFTDGAVIGAVLDRNGLRPSRYTVTKDGLVVMASETGALNINPEDVVKKGRLEPGKMFLIDIEEHRIVPDEEIKEGLAAQKPYRKWLDENRRSLSELPEAKAVLASDPNTLSQRLKAFGYTREDLSAVLAPMVINGKEPLGSMGCDTPLAVLSDSSPLLYNYFKQLFAQVTNPPLDAIREQVVTSRRLTLGAGHNLLEDGEVHCQRLSIDQPILTDQELARIKSLDAAALKTKTLDALFDASGNTRENHASCLEKGLEALCKNAEHCVTNGASILVLSDRNIDASHAAIPALLSASAVHHHLIRAGKRTPCSIVVESGEPREVHHFALLISYGVSAINPYVAFETLHHLNLQGKLGEDLSPKQVEENFIRAINKGVIKTISKMGISTIRSYRGAQIFESVGLDLKLVERYFTDTPARISGIGLAELVHETVLRHRAAYPQHGTTKDSLLSAGGRYKWRRGEERHLNNPLSIAKLQQAVRANSADTYKEYSRLINEQNKALYTLRGLLEFRTSTQPVPIEEVEPAKEIVKRFKTGAMSFGSISFEAHANLAAAMNRIGAKSNSGEGGEDPIRYRQFESEKERIELLGSVSTWAKDTLKPEDSISSAIKQVASARFGVTSEYLVNASELQIKIAQGAKPGEGGHLPGHKVDNWIAAVRHSTPGVGLISPPPHHDIYSIEDLAQLIYDLKCANRHARITVKLVSEVGVGTVAAGVSKGKADVVLISGGDGGTGASPLSSIHHAGIPWELGLAETHQVLLGNNLRNRIAVEVDGQLKTGRDVAIGCLLGAEEFGFATAPLIASGCIMMRKCHLNTCPVGVATQDPELRKKFAGKPEHVINFMFFVAEEMRQIMASLGFRTVQEMVGRTDKLDVRAAVEHWKASGLDLAPLLSKPDVPEEWGPLYKQSQTHGIENSLDISSLLEAAERALIHGERVFGEFPIRNINRTVGTIAGSELTKRWGSKGLPADTLHFKFNGSAGQSFAAFTPQGMTMELEGDANDYFGKGLSGAKLILYPPKSSSFVPEENIIVGNVALYGATSGEAYIRGIAGERFCVRNSGVRAVVEGLGEHGCEYMTGGRVVVLGQAGRNFAAGMSGGIAYIYDRTGDFGATKCNLQMVELESLVEEEEIIEVRQMIENHVSYTKSSRGTQILINWEETLRHFVKVIPTEYRRALEKLKEEERRAAA